MGKRYMNVTDRTGAEIAFIFLVIHRLSRHLLAKITPTRPEA